MAEWRVDIAYTQHEDRIYHVEAESQQEAIDIGMEELEFEIGSDFFIHDINAVKEGDE